MKKLLVALCCLVWCSEKVSAQGADKCANSIQLSNLLQEHPEYMQIMQHRMNHLEAQDNLFQQSQLTGLTTQAKTTATTYIIPVVFHVILTQTKLSQLGGIQGVETRMISQLEALNRDFTGANADSVNIPAPFKPLFGKADLLFHPAHRKPNNTGTSGVEILVTTINSFSATSGASGLGSNCKNPATGGLAAWDPMKYYNIWVVDISESGILGYAVPPSYNQAFGIPLNEVGVVLDYGAFGRRTSVTQFFSPNTNDLGRTLTHETGHFFELYHTFGENPSCPGSGDSDDAISDTPPQAKETYSGSTTCPSFPRYDACTPTGNGIMFMNFMDYVDDRCMYLFTKGQIARMRSQIGVSPIITSLTQHPEVLAWPTDVAEIPAEDGLVIYPNPSNGKFELQFANASGLQGITVTNLVGQVVKNIDVADASINNYHIDLTGFNKGVYMVHCTFATGNITKKIVLQ